MKLIQNLFLSSLGFSLFSDEEFHNGFSKTCKQNNTQNYIRISDVKTFLHYTFNFTPLDEEVKGNYKYY